MNPERRRFLKGAAYVAASVGMWPHGVSIAGPAAPAFGPSVVAGAEHVAAQTALNHSYGTIWASTSEIGGYLYSEQLSRDLRQACRRQFNPGPPTRFIPFTDIEEREETPPEPANPVASEP